MADYIELTDHDTHLNIGGAGTAVLYVYDGQPYIRVEDGTIIGVTGVSVVDIGDIEPLVLTQTYSTADATLAAYTPDTESVAYVGADASALLIELNALRVAYENLRLFSEDQAKFINSLVNGLRDIGLVA